MALRRLVRCSRLGVPAEELWAQATSFAGINYELAPILKMTEPRGGAGLTIAAAEPGVALGRSRLLLAGLLPVDYDDICLAEIEAPRRFLERSSMLTMSRWEHERTIEPRTAGTCVLTDRVGFELRRPLALLPGSGALAGLMVEGVFAHRHRRLRSRHPTDPTE